MTNKTRKQERRERRLRLWPAVVIILAYFAIYFGVSLFAATMYSYLVGVVYAPLGAALLLVIWWLSASRARAMDRILGFLLFLGAQLWILFIHGSLGYIVLAKAMPIITVLVVVLLVITTRMKWTSRRWLLVAAMLCSAAVFSLMRPEGIGGDLSPQLSWRWSPTEEDLLAKLSLPEEAVPALSADVPTEAGPLDWPGFRGAERDGRVTGIEFSTDWSDSPKELWRRPVGLAWSSFTVIGDYVFTQEQRGQEEAVVCYRADTGDEVWVSRTVARFEGDMGTGPRATPTFDQGRLYTFGATGIVQCVEASTGEIIWKSEVMEDIGVKLPEWGFASSPLVTDKLVIVFAGGRDGKSVAAYDRESGALAWCAGDGKTGYSSGQLVSLDGVAQVLMNSNSGVQSFVPDTGEVLWQHEWKVKGNPRVVQPLMADANSVLLGTAAGMGTRSLRIQKEEESWQVEEQWTTRGFRPYFNDFVLHNGYCYGFDGNRLTCINAATGERRWRGGSSGGQVLLVADIDALVVLTEKGRVMLVQAQPDSYKKLGEFAAVKGKTWNHPVIAYGKLFVRNDREAVCFELPN